MDLESALHLPELHVAPEPSHPADIAIRLGTVLRRPSVGETGCAIWVGDNQACYVYRGTGAFQVSSGLEILVEPDSCVTPEALRLALLGPVLALALHQRGLFTLHGSANAIDGTAVAFLGTYGSGKSTMSAMLHARGYPAISDDLVVLRLKDHTVLPSIPQLKLWPDALEALGVPAHDLPRVHPDVPKRALQLTEEFARGALSLRRLYLLGVGGSTVVEPLSAGQCFEEVLRHWYGVRFGPTYLRSLDARQHFTQTAQLARDVPMRRLQRPATLSDDPDLPNAVVAEIRKDLGYC